MAQLRGENEALKKELDRLRAEVREYKACALPAKLDITCHTYMQSVDYWKLTALHIFILIHMSCLHVPVN